MKSWLDGPLVTTSLFDHCVTQRQIKDADHFIAPVWPDDLHDPFLLPDMEKVTGLLWDALEHQRDVTIIGDYDMDGTPAAALLAEFWVLFGQQPQVILPTRSDGYGFQPHFVPRIPEGSIIITVDCGIRDHEAIAQAKDKKCTVIVTDHHECPAELPPADAILNPKRLDSHYPFRELCGTGLVYKLLMALVGQAPGWAESAIPPNWLAWMLDLVVLATIGDMVPLLGENRVLAHYGMRVLRRTRRPGLAHLIQALGLEAATLTYQDIAYKLLPKLNASGRMERMDEVFDLLVSRNGHRLDQALTTILTRATQSQLLLQAMMEEAELQAAQQVGTSVIVVANETWHPGLTGIVAGRLVEKFHVPTAVLAGVGDGYRGSMRSVRGVALPELLTSAQPLLERFGGHEQAAGLSLLKHNLGPFVEHIQVLSISRSESVITTDGLVSPEQITLETVSELGQLEPWGVGHPEPLWSLHNVTLKNIRWLSDGKHLKATFGANGTDCIYFQAQVDPSWLAQPLDIFGTVGINEFKGRRTPQFIVKGVYAPHG